MAKSDKPKPAPKPKNKKEQYERFKETARELGVDDPKSAEDFEETFGKIVPARGPKHDTKSECFAILDTAKLGSESHGRNHCAN